MGLNAAAQELPLALVAFMPRDQISFCHLTTKTGRCVNDNIETQKVSKKRQIKKLHWQNSTNTTNKNLNYLWHLQLWIWKISLYIYCISSQIHQKLIHTNTELLPRLTKLSISWTLKVLAENKEEIQAIFILSWRVITDSKFVENDQIWIYWQTLWLVTTGCLNLQLTSDPCFSRSCLQNVTILGNNEKDMF